MHKGQGFCLKWVYWWYWMVWCSLSDERTE